MSSFTKSLIVEPLDNGKDWKLVEEFDYYIDISNNEIIKIPAGFITDFASIPRIFWNILPPYGKYGKAAVVHDYCYRNMLYTRLISDKIFLNGMKILKVNFFVRYIMFYGVRLFGANSYKRVK